MAARSRRARSRIPYSCSAGLLDHLGGLPAAGTQRAIRTNIRRLQANRSKIPIRGLALGRPDDLEKARSQLSALRFDIPAEPGARGVDFVGFSVRAEEIDKTVRESLRVTTKAGFFLPGVHVTFTCDPPQYSGISLRLLKLDCSSDRKMEIESTIKLIGGARFSRNWSRF